MHLPNSRFSLQSTVHVTHRLKMAICSNLVLFMDCFYIMAVCFTGFNDKHAVDLTGNNGGL